MTITDLDQQRGLYGKYYVARRTVQIHSHGPGTSTVTRSDPGPVFVLAYETDPHARNAFAAYNPTDQERTDNARDFAVQKHTGKPTGPVFVLPYADDARARAALITYAESCRDDFPQLSADLIAEATAHGGLT